MHYNLAGVLGKSFWQVIRESMTMHLANLLRCLDIRHISDAAWCLRLHSVPKLPVKISFEEGRSSSNSSRTSAMPPQSPAVDGGPSQSLRYSQSIYSQGSRPGVRPTPRESERPTHRESIIGDLPRMPGARPINRETAVGDLPRTTGTGHRRSNSGESILSGISNASNRPTMAQPINRETAVGDLPR